jgi:hypothetical protein
LKGYQMQKEVNLRVKMEQCISLSLIETLLLEDVHVLKHNRWN